MRALECLKCLMGLASVAVVIGGIFGLGWLVFQPLGHIRTVRLTSARFQLLDLFRLLILLQPSLGIFASLVGDPQSRLRYDWSFVVTIFVLVWIGTITAWGVTTSVLSKVGVVSPYKRATAVLLLLPMIGLVNPFALAFNFMVVMSLVDSYRDPWWATPFYLVALDVALIAAIIGCRRLSRWIASGAAHVEPRSPPK